MVSTDQFWSNLTELRETGEFSDGTIVLDDGSDFKKIHKVVLAAGSWYFKTLFRWNPDQKVFHLKEYVTKEAMEQILTWIYSRKLMLQEDNLQEVLKTANYLDCFEVVDQCKQYMLKGLCFKNVVGFWNFAATYQIQGLEEKFRDFVACHYIQVQKTEEFFDLMPENLHTVLKRNDIDADEKTIFQSVMNWIYHEKDSRQEYLSDLLQCIRLGCAGADFFKEHFQQNSVIEEACKGNKTLNTFMESVSAYFTKGPTRPLPALAQSRSLQLVLVIGGRTSKGTTNTIDCFNPRTDTWYATSLLDPLGPRQNLGAAVIGSKLYLVGGHNGQERFFKEGTVLDLATGEVKNIAPMSVARSEVSLVSSRGCLYACGGTDGTSVHKSFETYDPVKDQWTSLPEMQQSRTSAGSTVVGDLICLAGGWSELFFEISDPLDSVEVFNTQSGEWVQGIPNMTCKRGGLSCTTLKDELYILGGGNLEEVSLDTCEKYNFKAKMWTKIKDMKNRRDTFASVTFDTRILAFGGDRYEHDDFEARITDVAEAYDELVQWQTSKQMMTPRADHAAVVAEMPFNLLLRDEDNEK